MGEARGCLPGPGPGSPRVLLTLLWRLPSLCHNRATRSAIQRLLHPPREGREGASLQKGCLHLRWTRQGSSGIASLRPHGPGGGFPRGAAGGAEAEVILGSGSGLGLRCRISLCPFQILVLPSTWPGDLAAEVYRMPELSCL